MGAPLIGAASASERYSSVASFLAVTVLAPEAGAAAEAAVVASWIPAARAD
jgi:hypothetical protein